MSAISPSQRKGMCGHIMAAFDLHLRCARCRDKKKGDDPCVRGLACSICESFTPIQLQKLATPVYQQRQALKSSTHSDRDISHTENRVAAGSSPRDGSVASQLADEENATEELAPDAVPQPVPVNVDAEDADEVLAPDAVADVVAERMSASSSPARGRRLSPGRREPSPSPEGRGKKRRASMESIDLNRRLARLEAMLTARMFTPNARAEVPQSAKGHPSSDTPFIPPRCSTVASGAGASRRTVTPPPDEPEFVEVDSDHLSEGELDEHPGQDIEMDYIQDKSPAPPLALVLRNKPTGKLFVEYVIS